MPDRTNPRHPAFDYRSEAAYFVTMCTHKRRCLFGMVRRGRMVCNAYGRIVVREWERSEEMRDEIVLDAFVVMPNHLHGIVCIVPPDVDDVSPRGYDLNAGGASMSTKRIPNDEEEATGRSPLHQRGYHSTRGKDDPNGPSPKSLGSMIAGFKGAVTTRINEHRGTPGAAVWQSRYHDRILRSEREWRIRRTYIERNPEQWAGDRPSPRTDQNGAFPVQTPRAGPNVKGRENP